MTIVTQLQNKKRTVEQQKIVRVVRKTKKRIDIDAPGIRPVCRVRQMVAYWVAEGGRQDCGDPQRQEPNVNGNGWKRPTLDEIMNYAPPKDERQPVVTFQPPEEARLQY